MFRLRQQKKRNEAGTTASILTRERGRNVFLKMRNGECFGITYLVTFSKLVLQYDLLVVPVYLEIFSLFPKKYNC